MFQNLIDIPSTWSKLVFKRPIEVETLTLSIAISVLKSHIVTMLQIGFIIIRSTRQFTS